MITNPYDPAIIKANIDTVLTNVANAALKSGRRPEDIAVMAATKKVPAAVVNTAIDCGIALLGENRAQELCEKYADYHKEKCHIHFIGALQTNKVRQIIDKVDAIQSVDRLSLAEEIQRQCEKINREMDILIEVNIAGEASKSGVDPAKITDFVSQIASFSRLKVKGLMCVPPIYENYKNIREIFDKLYKIFVDMQSKKIDNINMTLLSMGMSGDYEAAIESGANLVRVGTAIFGKRS